jgi:hypothetical protein
MGQWKSPGLAGAFFDSLFSLADWKKLFCKLYLVCFVRAMWFWYLTSDFAQVFGIYFLED